MNRWGFAIIRIFTAAAKNDEPGRLRAAGGGGGQRPGGEARGRPEAAGGTSKRERNLPETEGEPCMKYRKRISSV
jgi:hypothetical protein